jgi:hypothetical protein
MMKPYGLDQVCPEYVSLELLRVHTSAAYPGCTEPCSET